MQGPGRERDGPTGGATGNVPGEQRRLDFTARRGNLPGGDFDDQPGGRHKHPHTSRFATKRRDRVRGAGPDQGTEEHDQRRNYDSAPRPHQSHCCPPSESTLLRLCYAVQPTPACSHLLATSDRNDHTMTKKVRIATRERPEAKTHGSTVNERPHLAIGGFHGRKEGFHQSRMGRNPDKGSSIGKSSGAVTAARQKSDG